MVGAFLMLVLSKKELLMRDEQDSFAIENKTRTILIVHILVGKMQLQIRSWFAEKFEYVREKRKRLRRRKKGRQNS